MLLNALNSFFNLTDVSREHLFLNHYVKFQGGMNVTKETKYGIFIVKPNDEKPIYLQEGTFYNTGKPALNNKGIRVLQAVLGSCLLGLARKRNFKGPFSDGLLLGGICL